MQHTAFQSSALSQAAYDVAARRLEVEFRDGAIYQYLGVSPEIYAALERAPSKGKFLNAAIRGRFPCEVIRRSKFSCLS
jgi:hypothetical protein